MQFDYDIYISYANPDNVPGSEQDKGWVSNLQRFLEMMLGQVLRKKPVFLTYSNQEKPSADALSKVAVLICVVSPEYIKSGDGVEDIDSFMEGARKSSDMDPVKRVFKVVKSPVSAEDEHSKLKGMISYDLFQVDPITAQVQEINDFFSPEAEKNYWMKLVDVAYDVNKVLKEIKALHEAKSKKTEKQAKESIYLAETGHDLIIERNIIKRELLRHGYRVLPEQNLPTNLKEMEAAIKKDLESCKLSIHLIGENYGDAPKGTDRSIVDIQNKIAAERSNMASALDDNSAENVFSRLIWVSPELKNITEKQKIFIENLKRDVETLENTEILQTPLEDLKSAIHKELLYGPAKKQKSFSENSSGSKSNELKVYLLYDKADSENIGPLKQHLINQEYTVLEPKFEGDLLALRNLHIENLRTCDLGIVFFGEVNEQWVKMKLLDLLKAPGFGREKAMLGKAIYISNSGTPQYDFYKNYDVKLIENPGKFSSDYIQSFLTKIEKVK